MDTIENNVYEITSSFAIRIVHLYKYLTEVKHEYIMSKQLFRSGTSIGVGMSVVIIFIYYILFATGKALAKAGTLSPFLGVWLCNFIIGAIGILLIFKSKA